MDTNFYYRPKCFILTTFLRFVLFLLGPPNRIIFLELFLTEFLEVWREHDLFHNDFNTGAFAVDTHHFINIIGQGWHESFLEELFRWGGDRNL